MVAAAKMDLVRDNVEADLVIDDVSGKFGGVPVVLMAQRENDGMPAYYGDGDLVDLLANVPLEKMPWQEYPMS